MVRQARNLRAKLLLTQGAIKRGQLVAATAELERAVREIDEALERAKEFGLV